MVGSAWLALGASSSQPRGGIGRGRFWGAWLVLPPENVIPVREFGGDRGPSGKEGAPTARSPHCHWRCCLLAPVKNS